MSHGYVWALYGYQLYTARTDGSDVRPLAPGPGYNAEATVSRDGWVVFTSTRDGDLDLYKMRLDGSELTRLTSTPGYDGGAFFSPTGSASSIAPADRRTPPSSPSTARSSPRGSSIRRSSRSG